MDYIRNYIPSIKLPKTRTLSLINCNIFESCEPFFKSCRENSSSSNNISKISTISSLVDKQKQQLPPNPIEQNKSYDYKKENYGLYAMKCDRSALKRGILLNIQNKNSYRGKNSIRNSITSEMKHEKYSPCKKEIIIYKADDEKVSSNEDEMIYCQIDEIKNIRENEIKEIIVPPPRRRRKRRKPPIPPSPIKSIPIIVELHPKSSSETSNEKNQCNDIKLIKSNSIDIFEKKNNIFDDFDEYFKPIDDCINIKNTTNPLEIDNKEYDDLLCKNRVINESKKNVQLSDNVIYISSNQSESSSISIDRNENQNINKNNHNNSIKESNDNNVNEEVNLKIFYEKNKIHHFNEHKNMTDGKDDRDLDLNDDDEIDIFVRNQKNSLNSESHNNNNNNDYNSNNSNKSEKSNYHGDDKSNTEMKKYSTVSDLTQHDEIYLNNQNYRREWIENGMYYEKINVSKKLSKPDKRESPLKSSSSSSQSSIKAVECKNDEIYFYDENNKRKDKKIIHNENNSYSNVNIEKFTTKSYFNSDDNHDDDDEENELNYFMSTRNGFF